MRRLFATHLKGSFDPQTILRIKIDDPNGFVHERASLFCALFLENSIVVAGSLEILEGYDKVGHLTAWAFLRTNRMLISFEAVL